MQGGRIRQVMRKTFFQARSVAKVASGVGAVVGSKVTALRCTVGTLQRKNGLMANSCAMVEGRVGRPRSRCCWHQCLVLLQHGIIRLYSQGKAQVAQCVFVRTENLGARWQALPIAAARRAFARPCPQTSGHSRQKTVCRHKIAHRLRPGRGRTRAICPAVWPGTANTSQSVPSNAMRCPACTRSTGPGSFSWAGPARGTGWPAQRGHTAGYGRHGGGSNTIACRVNCSGSAMRPAPVGHRPDRRPRRFFRRGPAKESSLKAGRG